MKNALAPNRHHSLLAALVVSTFWAQSVRAQEIPDGVGVADRVHPEFQPVGGRIGSFFIYPDIQATLEADDNVFARNEDKRSDFIAVAEPSVRIQSIWTQHALQATAYYRHMEYFSNDTETTDEYGAEMTGRFDMDRTSSLRFRLKTRHEAEKRYNISSDTSSLTPIEFEEVVGLLGMTKQFGRLRFDASGSVRSLRYADNVARNGNFIDGRLRDVNIKSAYMTVKYASGSAFNAFIHGEFEKRDFPFGPGDPDFDPSVNLARDSKGGRLEVGVSIELKDRLYGNVRAGYLFQNYADPRLADLSGVSYGADLLWNLSRLTSVRIGVNRAVETVTSTIDAGLFRTRYSAVVSHELRRNIVLTGSVEYSTVKPIGPSARNREIELGGGIRYLANRNLSAELGFVHRSRSSDEDRLKFSANRGIFRLRVQL